MTITASSMTRRLTVVAGGVFVLAAAGIAILAFLLPATGRDPRDMIVMAAREVRLAWFPVCWGTRAEQGPEGLLIDLTLDWTVAELATSDALPAAARAPAGHHFMPFSLTAEGEALYLEYFEKTAAALARDAGVEDGDDAYDRLAALPPKSGLLVWRAHQDLLMPWPRDAGPPRVAYGPDAQGSLRPGRDSSLSLNFPRARVT